MPAKRCLIPLMLLSICLSTAVMAKGNPHDRDPEARWRNSNRQSDTYSTRGRERANQRQQLKHTKDYRRPLKKQHRDHDDAYRRRDRWQQDHQDRYRRQVEKERNALDRRYRRYDERSYPQNPVDMLIDRNINDAKSRIDNLHHRVIEGIDDHTREFTGVDTRR